MRFLFLLLLLPFMSTVWAQGTTAGQYVQFLAGELHLGDGSASITHEDTGFEAEVSTLPYLGGAVQQPLRDRRFGYGWEAGAFLSWKNDQVSYYAKSGGNGTQVRVNVDNAFWAIETFMGGYLQLKAADRARLYVSGGPLVMFGYAESEDVDDEVTIQSATVIIKDGDSSDYDLSLGWYGRAGAEIRVGKNTWIGASVRYMDVELDLSDSLGDFSIDGEMYLLTVSNRY